MPNLFLRLFPILFLASNAAAADVLVFTDSRHPLQATADARVIELDRPLRIEAELSAGLHTDPDRAVEIARQRLHDPDLHRRLQTAYQGVVDARSLNVAKIPAVVVDRRYVVYGESDISRAIARIDAYRSAQP
jgi:integrating conjugative element protein (TIGR03757 family)